MACMYQGYTIRHTTGTVWRMSYGPYGSYGAHEGLIRWGNPLEMIVCYMAYAACRMDRMEYDATLACMPTTHDQIWRYSDLEVRSGALSLRLHPARRFARLQEELGEYLRHLVFDKEQREYMAWLRKVHAFVQ
jgi:hypothetical protein